MNLHYAQAALVTVIMALLLLFHAPLAWLGLGVLLMIAEVLSGEGSLLAFGLSFQEMEKKMLEEALRKSGGNVSEASRLLKITRNTLRYRMAKHHIH